MKLEKLKKNDKKFQKPGKKANFVNKKLQRICDTQKLKPIPLQLRIFQYFIIQSLMRFAGPWDSNNLNNDNKCQKI